MTEGFSGKGPSSNGNSNGKLQERRRKTKSRSKSKNENNSNSNSNSSNNSSITSEISSFSSNRRAVFVFAFVFFIAYMALRRELLATARAACNGIDQSILKTESTTQHSMDSTQQHSPPPSPSSNTVEPYSGPQTTYRRWKRPFPCFPAEKHWNAQGIQRSPADTGLLYTREMKTGSSTLAGVLLRIAHNHAQQDLPFNESHVISKQSNKTLPCRLRVDHISARQQQYINRSKSRSYHISMLRDPTKRAVSAFFHFRVSDQRVDPTDAHFQSYFLSELGSRTRWNYYLKDLSLNQTKVEEFLEMTEDTEELKLKIKVKEEEEQNDDGNYQEHEEQDQDEEDDGNEEEIDSDKQAGLLLEQLNALIGTNDKKKDDKEKEEKNDDDNDNNDALLAKTDELIDDILQRYDFIAITERLDESLVVLKLLLDLDYEDILYMSAKRKGTFTPGGFKEHPCVYIVPSFLTDGMKEFFAGPFWNQLGVMGADQRLYAAAVKSLDNTIDALGREKVEEQVKIFQRALEYTHKACEERTVYRCNAKGEFVGRNSTCYLWDIGCGYECLNEVDVSAIVQQIEEEERRTE